MPGSLNQEMKNKQVNLAIQVLPVTDSGISYDIVDEAIRLIAESGHTYHVCPFETVVECTLEEALTLVEQVQKVCRSAGAKKMLTNIKLQIDFEGEVTIADKMEKYA